MFRTSCYPPPAALVSLSAQEKAVVWRVSQWLGLRDEWAATIYTLAVEWKVRDWTRVKGQVETAARVKYQAHIDRWNISK